MGLYIDQKFRVGTAFFLSTPTACSLLPCHNFLHPLRGSLGYLGVLGKRAPHTNIADIGHYQLRRKCLSLKHLHFLFSVDVLFWKLIHTVSCSSLGTPCVLPCPVQDCIPSICPGICNPSISTPYPYLQASTRICTLSTVLGFVLSTVGIFSSLLGFTKTRFKIRPISLYRKGLEYMSFFLFLF